VAVDGDRAGLRRDVDDLAGLLLDHRADDLLSEREWSSQVDRDGLVPVFLAELGERLDAGHPCAVDQDVRLASERREGVLRGLASPRRRTQIAGDGVHGLAGGLDQRLALREGFLVSSDERYLGAGFGQ